MIAAQALLMAGGMIFLNSCGNKGRVITDSDTTIIPAETPGTDTLENKADDSAGTKYYIAKNDGMIAKNSELWVYVDGKNTKIGTISDLFGEQNNCNMNLFAQEDFDGDGDLDALVYDANLGNGGGSSWLFIVNEGNRKFVKTNEFGECYTEQEISTVDGRKVADFIKEDLGRKIVLERHGLRNGKAVSLPVPKVKSEKFAVLKSIDMASLGDGNDFNLDLNGDGKPEKINTTSIHFGRIYRFTLNGKDYDFSTAGMWGQGKLDILQSKTNGMHDLLVTDTDGMRYRYKWDGNTYNE